MEQQFEPKRPSMIPVILVGFAFVGSLGFLASVLMQSCEKKPEVPRLRASVHSDFYEQVANFLLKNKQDIRIPVVHCLIFLSQEVLDPEYYQGKGQEDLKYLDFTEENFFELDGCSAEDILNLTFSRFNHVRKETKLMLDPMLAKLKGMEEMLASELEDYVEFQRITTSNVRYTYETDDIRSRLRLDLTLTNGSTKPISGFTWTMQFKTRKGLELSEKDTRTKTFNDSMEPGESRAFTFRHSNFTSYVNFTPKQYSQLYEEILTLDSAYLLDGTQISADLMQSDREKRIKELKALVDELRSKLEKSQDPLKFEFWRYLQKDEGKNRKE